MCWQTMLTSTVLGVSIDEAWRYTSSCHKGGNKDCLDPEFIDPMRDVLDKWWSSTGISKEQVVAFSQTLPDTKFVGKLPAAALLLAMMKTDEIPPGRDARKFWLAMERVDPEDRAHILDTIDHPDLEYFLGEDAVCDSDYESEYDDEEDESYLDDLDDPDDDVDKDSIEYLDKIREKIKSSGKGWPVARFDKFYDLEVSGKPSPKCPHKSTAKQ